MNVVLVIADTVRRDYLGCYGSTWCKTPNLDRLAEESFVFDRAYCSSYPTVPNRWDVLTGKHNYTYAAWEPLSRDEVTLGMILEQGGMTSMMIADTPHIFQHGFNYSRGFTAWQWIRGQENDLWQTDPKEVEFPCSPEKMRKADYTVTQYLRNTALFQHEEDYFAPKTMKTAMQWIERNRDLDNFFLYVDTFDPHEPWDAPDYYVDMYNPGYKGEKVFYPQYWPSTYLTDEEVQHCRAMYAAELTMVDRWVGKLLDKIDALGLRETTAVIFTTDHGFLLGEHGVMGKSIIFPDYFEALPFYEEISHIPLMIRLPGQTDGERVDALCVSTDLMMTVLEMSDMIETEVIDGESTIQLIQCGFHTQLPWSLDPAKLHSKSLMPILNGEEETVRDFAVSSFPLKYKTPRNAKASVVTEDGWNLQYSGASPDPSKELTPPEFECGKNEGDYQMGDHAPLLFNLNEDPGQIKNVIKENPDKAKEIHAAYVKYLEECETAPDLLEFRRDLEI